MDDVRRSRQRPDRDVILAALSDDERHTLNDIRRLLR